jgi:hypothetical protein
MFFRIIFSEKEYVLNGVIFFHYFDRFHVECTIRILKICIKHNIVSTVSVKEFLINIFYKFNHVPINYDDEKFCFCSMDGVIELIIFAFYVFCFTFYQSSASSSFSLVTKQWLTNFQAHQIIFAVL